MRPWTAPTQRAGWLAPRLINHEPLVWALRIEADREIVPRHVNIGLRAEIWHNNRSVAWARGIVNRQQPAANLRLFGDMAVLDQGNLLADGWELRLSTDEPLAIVHPRATHYWRGDVYVPLREALTPAKR